jgi:hypothetical protein
MMAEMLGSRFSKLNVCAEQGPQFQLGWDLKVNDFKCKRPNLAGCDLKLQLPNGALSPVKTRTETLQVNLGQSRCDQDQLTFLGSNLS